ncbi:thymidine phosphorylase [Christensenella tenuis]|uniref:Pyrimidine-nucleoside phosphorylase n=1 Tax=Christensenella tenuis TaxID=2763033 RepID=A0ABR7EEW5_9FIRM|nr:thymidine phosphorylase [Christensenella tenuis]MBC5648307.1 thymidine phosphorylase [Christensenella tenuis]
MKMYEILNKKRYGEALTPGDIDYVVKRFTDGEIPDYQMAALLMAIAINGMDDTETFALTKSMVETGETADLSAIRGIKVDKHSSGGVGDKTSPIVGAIVAACGVPVAKMSGRSLGFSGGTVDKLEAIPGYSIAIEKERFFEIVNTVGVSIIGQTGNLAPADKKIYQLRDVTATVESIPLIASSIMSKKIAGSADAILLDVKTGNGAFMKDIASATALAEKMVAIGKRFGKHTVALVTQMNCPLGNNIGTSLEVIEMIQVLHGNKAGRLKELCCVLAANMLYLAQKGSLEACEEMAAQALESGRAFRKFREMVAAHGGDVTLVDHPERFPEASCIKEVRAWQDGFVQGFQTEKCGMASMALGAGRENKDAQLDYTAGVCLAKGYGDPVRRGDILASLHTSRPETLDRAEQLLREGIVISGEGPKNLPLVYARIDSETV